jgi:hypothetical protein
MVAVVMIPTGCAYANGPRPDDFTDEYRTPLAIIGIVLGIVAVLAVMLFRHFRRVNAVARATPAPLSLLVVEKLARSVQRHNGVIAAVGIAGVPVTVAMGMGGFAIISTLAACIGARGFFITRAALQLIEAGHDRVTAEAIAHIVVLRTTGNEVRFEVAPRAMAAALHRAIPTSIVKL